MVTVSPSHRHARFCAPCTTYPNLSTPDVRSRVQLGFGFQYGSMMLHSLLFRQLLMTMKGKTFQCGEFQILIKCNIRKTSTNINIKDPCMNGTSVKVRFRVKLASCY